jgi:hypothetical protein
MNQFEIISTHDKNARDQIFDELRHSDLPNERQVVRFSDCEPVLSGLPHGEIKLDSKNLACYVSTWSVAYPRHEEDDETKSRRRSQRDRREKVGSLGEQHSDRGLEE